MSDYIKREDALNAFSRVYMIPGRGTAREIYAKQIENTYKQIESVPSADVVEQKHGKWKDSNYNLVWNADGVYKAAYQCSNCGACFPIAGYYCPNCGARMDGE